MKRLPYRLYFLLLILLPAQIGKHVWINESLVLGRKIDYLSPTLYLTDLLIIFFVATVVWQIRPHISRGWLYSLLIVLTLAVISLINFGGTPLGFYQCLKIVEWWCFAWCVAVLSPSLVLTALGLSVAVTWSSSLALLQFLSQQSLNGIWYWVGERTFDANTPGIAQLVVLGRLFLRPYATFPHPNVLGGILVLISPFLLFARTKTRLSWVWLRVTQALLLLGIGLSFSRSVWMTAIFVFGIFLFKKNWVNRQWPVLLLGAVSVLITEELLLGRFASLFQVDQVSVWERQRLVLAASKLWSGSPLFGLGVNRFISMLPQVSAPPFLLQPVHSIYVLWLVETGIVGMIAGLTLLVVAFKKCLQNKNTYLVIAWLALLILGTSDHYWLTLQQGQLLFSLLIGLTFAHNS